MPIQSFDLQEVWEWLKSPQAIDIVARAHGWDTVDRLAAAAFEHAGEYPSHARLIARIMTRKRPLKWYAIDPSDLAAFVAVVNDAAARRGDASRFVQSTSKGMRVWIAVGPVTAVLTLEGYEKGHKMKREHVQRGAVLWGLC
jgi:hypothetical protein